MSGLQKIAAGILLVVALAAGVGVYLNTRAPTLPEHIFLPDLDGKPHSLAEYAGKPLLINFWATWCPPCRREIPLLKALQDEYRDQGLVIVGIAVEDPQPVRKLAEDSPFNYPILIGETEAVELAVALGINFIGMPYSVFIDRRGRVSSVHTGELHRDEAELGLAAILP